MPAIEADIRRALRPALTVEAESSSIKARFPFARDQRSAPAEGFFDAQADAATALAARQALIGVEARRFGVRVEEIIWPSGGNVAEAWRLIDAELDVNGKLLVSRIEIDCEDEVTRLELVG